jgi:hypothetical protein
VVPLPVAPDTQQAEIVQFVRPTVLHADNVVVFKMAKAIGAFCPAAAFTVIARTRS